MHRTITILCALYLQCVSALGQNSQDLFAPVRSSLDQQFNSLDKTRVPYGLLLDYSIDLVDFNLYNGTALDDNNYVDIECYENLLRSIYSAAVTNDKPLSDMPEEVMKDFINSYTSTSIPLSVMAFKYSYIRADALTNNLIDYDPSTGSVSDITENNTWVNPYDSAYVAGFAPVVESYEGANVTFSFSLEYFFTNLNLSSNGVEFDAGDGNGYRTVSVPGTVPITYTLGSHDLKIRLTTIDNQVLQMHSKIRILPEPVAPSDFNSSPAFDYKTSFTSRVQYNGYSPSANMYVKYATNNTSGLLKKPFIVAECFDPFQVNQFPDSLGVRRRGSNNIASFLGYSSRGSRYINGGRKLNEDYGFDIVYIDWDKSTAPISTNADIIEQVIQWVNAHKATNAEKNILYGQSIGGLIARYALCRMAQKGEAHNCAAYVSHDTPHLGANIPLGYIYFLGSVINMLHTSGTALLTFVDVLSGIGEFFGGENSTTIQDALELINAPSFQQMSYYTVIEQGDQLMLSQTAHTGWLATMSSMGFPKGDNGDPFLNIAISNGGSFNYNQTDSLMTMSAYVETGLLTNIFALLVGVNPDVSTTSIKFQMEASVLPYLSTTSQVCQISLRYNKQQAWLVNGHTHYLINRIFTAPSGDFPMDSAKGSYYTTSSFGASSHWNDVVEYLIGQYECKLNIRERFMFVPSISSLCYKNGENINSSDYYIDYSAGNVLTYLQNTPFNGYYANSASSPHITFSDSMALWLNEVLNYQINGTLYPSTGDTLSVSNGTPSGMWSSSNESVAMINDDGVISLVGEGSADICYDGTKDYNGVTRPFHLSRRIEYGLPQFRLTNTKINGPIGPPHNN